MSGLKQDPSGSGVCVGGLEQWGSAAGSPSKGLWGVATRKGLEPGGKCWYRMKTNGFKKRQFKRTDLYESLRITVRNETTSYVASGK